jgi:hypothetical protein
MEDQNICDILIETYNVNKFDNAAKDLKRALYEEAKKCCIAHRMEIYQNKGDTIPVKTNKRDILMKLIENHFDPMIQQPMPKFIAGPTTLTVHKSPDEKRMIYIFGEWHTGIKDCKMFQYDEKEDWNENNPDKMTIDYFLYELMKTTSAYLDIYFEFPAFSKRLRGYHQYVNFGMVDDHFRNLFQKFKKCINSSRTTGDCSLARVHFFDSRRKNIGDVVTGFNDLSKMSEKIDYLRQKYDKEPNRLKNKYIELVKTDKKLIYILNSLGSSNEQEFKDFWLKQLSDNELNTKETKSGKYEDRGTIEEIEIMKSIKDFTEKQFLIRAMSFRDKYIELVTTIFEESKRGVNKMDKDIIYNALEDIIQYTEDTNAIVADVYLLARMFKDFDMTKMKTHANNITDQPDKAYNVIIYAGDNHSKIYRRYLKEVAGFKTIASTGKSKYNGVHCIDMRRIPQPFFSTWSRIKTWEDLWAKYIVDQIKEEEYKTFEDLVNSPD